MPSRNRREQILQAAEKLFTSRRFHEITLDDIVQEAHIGKGTIYTYFKGKDDLFFQLATSGFDELCQLLQRRVAEDAPFRQQLLQACGAISAFFARRRQLFRIIQTEDARMSLSRGSLRIRWARKRRRLAGSLGRILRKGQISGLVRRDLSAERLAQFLLGLLRTRARNLREQGASVSDELLVDLFLSGAGQAACPAQRPPGRDLAGDKARA